ncbi:MAG: Preprotein translocase SecG subunit [Planctomycetota bacterium]|jgi:preprotein translocase subunit SecG
MELLITFLYILFVLSAIVLVVVVLLQEGKGGGLTEALGTAGQQTFGVAASGIHKFTGWTGAIFLASALGLHVLNRMKGEESVVGGGAEITAPAAPAGESAAPTPPQGGQ